METRQTGSCMNLFIRDWTLGCVQSYGSKYTTFVKVPPISMPSLIFLGFETMVNVRLFLRLVSRIFLTSVAFLYINQPSTAERVDAPKTNFNTLQERVDDRPDENDEREDTVEGWDEEEEELVVSAKCTSDILN